MDGGLVPGAVGLAFDWGLVGQGQASLCGNSQIRGRGISVLKIPLPSQTPS